MCVRRTELHSFSSLSIHHSPLEQLSQIIIYGRAKRDCLFETITRIERVGGGNRVIFFLLIFH